MKRTVSFLLVLAAALLLGIRPVEAQTPLADKIAAIDRVEGVTALPSEEFKEKYELFIEQPLDWQRPEKGTFRHRVFVSHVGFDRPTVVITEGYGARYAANPAYREELSRLFDANMIFVEHRYFLASMPQPCDYAYLTAENSACDLHDIVTEFRKIYPGKYIATGISKGGTTTMLYATFFPDDVDIYVPYVGPVNRALEDGRHEKFLRGVGTPEQRKAVEDFQLEVLKRRERLMPLFREFCEKAGYEFRAPLEEIYDYCVLEYSFSFWQWGSPVSSIPALTASDAEIFDHFVKAVGPDYFAVGSPSQSFYIQAARELGYYGYDIKPFKDYLAIKSSKDYHRRLFLPEQMRYMRFDRTLCRKMYKYLKKSDPRMIMIYGEVDPWTASGAWWAATPGKRNMKAYVQPGGSHRTRISTLPEPMRNEVVETIGKWLAE